MSTSATLTRPVGHLGFSLDGMVVLPDDQRFDGARRAWNLGVDQRPAAVIFPESATAVAAAVGYAAERGLRVAAQGTGTCPQHFGPPDSPAIRLWPRLGPSRADLRVATGST